jgi:hypothetical protein
MFSGAQITSIRYYDIYQTVAFAGRLYCLRQLAL